MPYHFEYDATHRVLLTVISGEFSDEELLAVNEGIRERVEALRPAAGIGDFSEMTAFHASPTNVIAVARRPSPYTLEMPRFLVAPQDFVFGMARMYKMLADATRAGLRVVRTKEEAYQILGIIETHFVPLEPSLRE